MFHSDKVQSLSDTLHAIHQLASQPASTLLCYEKLQVASRLKREYVEETCQPAIKMHNEWLDTDSNGNGVLIEPIGTNKRTFNRPVKLTLRIIAY